jgi:hypothetical protein
VDQARAAATTDLSNVRKQSGYRRLDPAVPNPSHAVDDCSLYLDHNATQRADTSQTGFLREWLPYPSIA